MTNETKTVLCNLAAFVANICWVMVWPNNFLAPVNWFCAGASAVMVFATYRMLRMSDALWKVIAMNERLIADLTVAAERERQREVELREKMALQESPLSN